MKKLPVFFLKLIEHIQLNTAESNKLLVLNKDPMVVRSKPKHTPWLSKLTIELIVHTSFYWVLDLLSVATDVVKYPYETSNLGKRRLSQIWP